MSLYVIGVSCTYDVFDQQFATFFTSFFATGEKGTRVFGYVTTMGELRKASIMFFAPLIINRIGGKKMCIRDRYAGVSYQTVSRVVNQACHVSAKTREKVEAAMAELNYIPNRVAQQLDTVSEQAVLKA